jgi:hypothetical protein
MHFRKSVTMGAVCALALSLAPMDAAALSRSTSGFSRPAAARSVSQPKPSAPRVEAPKAEAPKATGGFGPATRAAPAEAPRPSGLMDRDVSKGVSRDAMEKFKASPVQQAPPVQQATPSYVQGGGQPQAIGQRPYYPPQYPSSYAPTYRPGLGYAAPGGSGFLPGMMTGFLLDRLLSPRPAYRDDNYDSQLRDIRRQLREIADNTSDPDEKSSIMQRLHDTESAQGPVAGADQVKVANPFDDRAPAKSSGHGFLIFLLISLALGGAAFAAWKFGLFGGRKDGAAPSFASSGSYSGGGSNGVAKVNFLFKPGCRVKLPAVAYLLASASGSVAKDLSGGHSATEVGTFDLYGLKVERAYFDDGKAFVERAVDPTRPGASQVRAYGLVDERFPSSAEDWAFFLGSDGASGVEPCDAYIGLPAVTIQSVGHDYDRAWGDGDGAVAARDVVEKVATSAGASRRVEHKMMQYARSLGTGDSSKAALFEYLYFESVGDDEGASIKIWVGIDVQEQTVEVA